MNTDGRRWPRGRGFAAKRAFDLTLASFVGIVLSPFIALLAIVNRLAVGSPVLFRQQRLGYRGKPFTLYKFRTMTDARDKRGELLPDAERITPFGRALRKSTLDELPELLNVLRGDMSLVGPRPLLPQYRELYTAEQWRRHEVPPGMAGPVVASGRNSLGWKDKFALDVWYVDNHSFAVDLKILGRAALQVLTARGVNQEGRATVDFFDGTDR